MSRLDNAPCMGLMTIVFFLTVVIAASAQFSATVSGGTSDLSPTYTYSYTVDNTSPSGNSDYDIDELYVDGENILSTNSPAGWSSSTGINPSSGKHTAHWTANSASDYIKGGEQKTGFSYTSDNGPDDVSWRADAVTDFKTGTVEGSLPVQLTTFVVIPSDCQVTLKWVTESEVDNMGFEIFRSEAVGDDYQKIAGYQSNEALKGAGNTSSRHEYQYIDHGLTNGVTYYYKLVDWDVFGNRQAHGPLNARPHPFEKTADDPKPNEFVLDQNYPNPFNPTTDIKFEVPVSNGSANGSISIDLKVYDVLGYEVKTLINEKLGPGKYSARWDGRDNTGKMVSSGVYIYKIKTPVFIGSKKMLFTR